MKWFCQTSIICIKFSYCCLHTQQFWQQYNDETDYCTMKQKMMQLLVRPAAVNLISPKLNR